jgi:tRNA_anti-like
MAIIACKECAREVSDKATSCPHCGVSIAGAARQSTRRVKPWVYGTSIVGLLAWAVLTTLWLTGTTPVPKELVRFIGTRSTLVRSIKASEKTVEPTPPAATTQSVPKLELVNSAVYRTSVEQLYQDYDANEVAIQSKIDGNPIRVSGSVAEINEDTSGHPVVTLHTGGGDNAEMLLIDDQRSAAAQLSKEDAVEIQCNKMQRTAARLRGSGCALVLVDAGGKLVYLAVSLSGKTGTAPLYIAGPMPRRTCLASGDSMAAQLASNPISEHILSKSCAATARESVSVEGCHLSSTMLAMPDLPTAHLWKYDCIVPGAKTRTAEAANSKGTREKRAAAIATLSEPVWELRPASVPQPMEAALVTASNSDAPALQQPAPVAVPAAVPAEAPAATVPDSTSAAPTPPPAAADDLASVRTKDPEAAVRIASYCSKITSGAVNPATVATRCRQDEVDAWTRLTVQNEFPALDETSRRKCNEPPFPDSFVARETCAKYQLHLD